MRAKTQEAVDTLHVSPFRLGADAPIAAGPVGGSARSNIVAGIPSFSRSKGAYAGVPLEGAVIKTRDK